MKFLFPVLVALLTIFAIAPLGYPGGFQSHSGLLAVYNLIDLDQQPLQFFNWAPVIGRSFDFLRGDGALPYWFALLFHRGGVSYLDSIKLVYALAWIASGLAMFALAKNFFADAGALLAVTVYVYLPYHIVTVYVRGAFAESVAWALFPIAMLALTRPRTKDEGRKTFAFTLFTFAFLFLTQPGLAILFAFVASLLIFAINGRAQNFARTVAPPLAGIFLGALFSLPLLARYGISFPRDGFTASFVFPFQLFSALWGYGTSTGSFLDQFPFQLGVVPLGFAIATLAIKTRAANEANRARTIALIFLGAAVILSALTFEIAAPLWSILNFFVSAPWQLLALVGFALAFAAGAVTKLDAQLARFPMLAVLVSLPVIASYNYLQPRFVDVEPTRAHIAIFGDNEIALLDYKILGPLRHGATVRLQLTWQALRALDRDYTIFVHAVHTDGGTWGEDDSKPLDGTLPTIKWTPGEIVIDTHAIQIDVEGPSEGYQLEFGLYQAANGRRAILANGADALRVPRPRDPPPIVPTR